MMIADINNMTIEELEVANLKFGVTLIINDGKIVRTEIAGTNKDKTN